MKFFFLSVIFLGSTFLAVSQDNFNDSYRGDKGIRIGFYNVENLFDTEDDPVKRDDEFTESGDKHWNKRKYIIKINQVGKVTTAVGGWEAVEIMAFCELENRRVLEDVLKTESMRDTDYEIVHFESPDRRGIDVGFIYRPDKVTLLHSEAIPIVFPWDENYKTRDILFARLVVLNADTIDFYVNHWPSRWRGQLETEESRMHVAKTLLQHRDTVSNPQKLIALGDFNDSPIDKSIKDVFKAEMDTSKPADYYNLMHPYLDKRGTNKFQGEWSIIDQIIVSNSLFNSTTRMQLKEKKANIFNANFLLEPDPKYEGMQLNRTYLGMRYKGGYSDHLPVYVDLSILD